MIEVKDIVKRFGRKTVLDQVSFTAEKGQITCLIGVNGMGKTTIMNAIMKLTPLQAGEILVDGEKVKKDTFEKIVFIPDATIMLPHFTIEMAMEFMKDFYQNWNQRRADDMLAFFKLNRKDKIASLSKGNTAKVNLLLGLAVDADYILMDEPFSGIDIFSREQIAEVFTSHLIEDRGVLITTHEIGDIEHLIDKVVLLNDGKIQKEFMTEDVRESEGKSVIDVLREVFVQ
ncbi:MULTISPECIES: ABC transporter ATP-binding protein [Allobacillus]|uniref:ABC transporter ATP-binding protein n=1 Tax=Allobacillus salarius TaxID=1955272 RepID=A0A556PA49_9BACI|nr:ABC transporter ATP-binding protein [Allobacillus salarius]TSJ61271.1 ABC transporter ATP-binding protein [Allobacillus salarius]